MTDVEMNSGLHKAPQQQESKADDGVNMSVKILGRVIAVIGALDIIIAGLVTLFSFDGGCIVAALLMIFIGSLVIFLEAPLFCPFLKFSESINNFMDKVPYFLRAGFYLIISIIPFVMCTELSTLFGCLGIFVTGTFYGVIAIGKKGDAVKAARNSHVAGG